MVEDRYGENFMKVFGLVMTYNCEKIIERTIRDLPKNQLDEIIFTDDGSTDKTVDIYLAYFNYDETIVGAINYFTGQIRNIGINENLNESTLQMTVASHWANWNLTKGRHFSDESQQSFSTGDKGFEFATQVKADVRWGV